MPLNREDTEQILSILVYDLFYRQTVQYVKYTAILPYTDIFLHEIGIKFFKIYSWSYCARK